MKTMLILLLVASTAYAENKFADLTAEDQKYYKNEAFAGNNQRERIDSIVRELNKMHGEMVGLKSEIQLLKNEVTELKKGK